MGPIFYLRTVPKMFIHPDNADSRQKPPKDSPPPITETNRSGNKQGFHKNPFLKNGNPTDITRGKQIPENIRATMGAFSIMSGIENTAKSFKVNRRVVQDAKFGTVTGQNSPSESLVDKIDSILKPARQIAIDRLEQSLKWMTEDKLQELDAVKLSKVASNISSVVKNLQTPELQNDNRSQAQVLIYSPEQKKQNDYPVIEVQ